MHLLSATERGVDEEGSFLWKNFLNNFLNVKEIALASLWQLSTVVRDCDHWRKCVSDIVAGLQ